MTPCTRIIKAYNFFLQTSTDDFRTIIYKAKGHNDIINYIHSEFGIKTKGNFVNIRMLRILI